MNEDDIYAKSRARIAELRELRAELAEVTSVLLDPEWIAAYVNESGLSTEIKLQRATEAAALIPRFAAATSKTVSLMDELNS